VSALRGSIASCWYNVRFVCATAKETAGVTRLRSYTLPDDGEIPATIREAALATSAATGYFDPVSIGARQFVDGALGANNPVAEESEEMFIACWAKQYDEKRFFRFNVNQGLQEVGLAEYKEQGTMEAATAEYLRHQEQKFRVRDCIANLQQKQSVYIEDCWTT
jgi:predicted acylesterase/phospholipase RssA